MKFIANDLVVYRTSGVCRIAEIKNCYFGGKQREYYILRPVHDEKSVIFVPVDSPLSDKMNRLLTKTEVDKIIDSSIPEKPFDWIENDRERTAKIKEVASSGDRKRITRMIKTLRLRRKALSACGKKLRVTDEAALTSAEKVLYDEFAYALGIARDEVTSYIEAKKAAAEKSEA